MSFKFNTSIFQLTAIGFFLVVLPLTAGLIDTLLWVDRLSTQMQQTIYNSAQTIEASRLITAQTLNMERSASQYLVLRDKALFFRYERQRVKLADAINQLQTLSLNKKFLMQLDNLYKHEQVLYDKLKVIVASPREKTPRLDELDQLAELAQPIPLAVSQMIANESEASNRQIEHVRKRLLWQALALIPLALLLAVIFSVLITRALRRLGMAIHLLGKGEFSIPIAVNGPQDVRELGEKLDWLRQRLAEIDAQKLTFLHHVSHELKTPLATIREGAELLCDQIVGPLTTEQEAVVQILRQDSLKLQSQVETLLDFNQALAQNKPLHLEVFDFSELVMDVLARHRLALRSRDIMVNLDLQPAFIHGEKQQLEVVVDNLLSNAVKYSTNNSVIKLMVNVENFEACFDVIDAGPGIYYRDKSRIFEPFFQGENIPQGPLKGTGLGLAIVHRYIEMHHGTITVLDKSQGAHFRIKLPAASQGEESRNVS